MLGTAVIALSALAAGATWASEGSSPPAHHVRAVDGTGTSSTAPATTTETAAGSATGPPARSTTVPPGPPYQVVSDTVDLLDPTRPSPARGDVAGTPERVLRTVVRRPIGALGPLPLIVFGPGFDTTPEAYEALLDAWAATGYLVAAPDFPGSASDLPGTPTETDIGQQARDLSFVISSLAGGRQGAVDPARIAVAGHSDGGSSVVVLAENPAYGDARIAAYLVLAGQIPDGVAGPWDARPAGALLCMVGSDDQYGNLQLTGAAYGAARMTKAMVTVPGGDHQGIFTGTGAVPEELRAATLRFLAAALPGPRPVTDAALAGALAVPPGAPPYEVVTG